MTREEFNNNSYLVNNNALYNKHTEHISTTEPLYLDGMPGSDNIVHEKSIDDGGDTPTKTLWKILNQGAYIFGEFEEGHLFIEGPGENLMYTADNQGRIATYDIWDPGAIPVIKSIFEPYFGEIESVTIKVLTGLNIGDDIPNWDAYEEITLLGYFAVNFGYNVFGYLKDSIYEMPRKANGETYTADNNGVIISQTVVPPGAPGYDSFIQAVKDKFLQNNIIVNEIVGKIESYSVGDNIENWNEYTKLGFGIL